MCEYLPHSKVPLVVGHKLGTNGNLKMGVLRADEARWDEALALYDRALQYCEQMRVTLYLPDIYLNRSEALIGKGELVEARKCLEKSLDLNRQYGQTVSLGEALYEMGELEWDMGQSEAALDPLREGVLSPEEAPRSPLRHVLSRSLGTIRTVEPQIDSCDWQDGDRLLLCTDGLHAGLAHELIASVLAEANTADEAAQHLLAATLVLDQADQDNLTALTVFLSTTK